MLTTVAVMAFTGLIVICGFLGLGLLIYRDRALVAEAQVEELMRQLTELQWEARSHDP